MKSKDEVWFDQMVATLPYSEADWLLDAAREACTRIDHRYLTGVVLLLTLEMRDTPFEKIGPVVVALCKVLDADVVQLAQDVVATAEVAANEAHKHVATCH